MLTGKDAALLKKLAPEFNYGSSQIPFRSVLPPLSNHFSEDVKDFENRLRRLSDEELAYLADLVMKGLESLTCVPPEHVEVFVALMAERISREVAEKVAALYSESMCECDLPKRVVECYRGWNLKDTTGK